MRSDMRQRRRRRNSGGIPTWLYIALIAVMAAVFCVSAYFLIDYIAEQNNAALSYNKLATSITRNPDAELPPDQSANEEYIPPILADHAALSEINPNYSFWLHLEDSVISYPVVSNVGNSYYLSHLFSQETGCSLIEYHARLRIDHAKLILSTTDIRIAELAELLGYSSPAAFINAFKARRGITPQKYRSRFNTRLSRD